MQKPEWSAVNRATAMLPGWKRSKWSLVLGALGGVMVVGVLRRRFASAAAAAAVPTIIFSKFLRDVEEGRIQKVLMGADEYLVYAKDATTGEIQEYIPSTMESASRCTVLMPSPAFLKEQFKSIAQIWCQ